MRMQRYGARRRRRGVGLPLFWLAVSAIYALTSVAAEFSGIPAEGAKGVLTVAAEWLAVSLCASGVIGLLSLSRVVFALLFPLLAALSGAIAYFYVAVGIGLNATSLEVALVNDATMWGSVMSPVMIAVTLGALAAGVAAAAVRWRRVEPTPRAALAVGCTSLVLAALPFAVARLQPAVGARMPYAVWFASRDYLRNRHVVAEQRTTFDHTPVAAPDSAPDVIFILGEALRADHLPMNGYARNTMPLFGADTALVSLPALTSVATHTYASVPHILTRADSADIERGYTEQSVITLFRRAGYRTAWFANQDLSSSYVYFAHEADTLVYGNSARSLYSYDKWLDSDLLRPLGEWLADSADARPRFAVVHTIGSHWWYKSHYADSAAVFLPDTDNKDITRMSHEQIVNAYDNTVVATDAFLAAVASMLRGRNAIMIYLSDHGEALGEEGVYLHAADVEPLHRPAGLVWYSDGYARRFPAKVSAIRAGAGRRASTDVAFHTLLDAASLQTPVLQPQLSLFR